MSDSSPHEDAADVFAERARADYDDSIDVNTDALFQRTSGFVDSMAQIVERNVDDSKQ
ncbi:hypothetical protein [Halomontanus rarus]|uniref:hypothetical protein n=1 Tax=Halomontanus rarus TaxID=3034020 RepID=UPI0023E8BF06|nr:hypothetical protein [Halovivax sp. TS33]